VIGDITIDNRWEDECQVACIDKHMCINKFESKACNKTMSWAQIYRSR